jgi:transcriptional regulator with XRE-family HTH domain
MTATERLSRGNLATILTILRNIRGMSQSELAQGAGVTNSAISDYERGKVDPQTATLRKLMGALSLPLSVLDDTQAYIDAIESQIGHGGAMVAVVEEAPAEHELAGEIALLAADGGRFVARFIRLLFLVLLGDRELLPPRWKRRP